MLKTILMAAATMAAASCSTPAMAEKPVTSTSPAADPRGPCPGAYIDYEHARPDPFGPGLYIPVQVQVQARSELRKCAKAGIKVPYTVAEYNNHSRLDEHTARQIVRDITVPRERWGEF